MDFFWAAILGGVWTVIITVLGFAMGLTAGDKNNK